VLLRLLKHSPGRELLLLRLLLLPLLLLVVVG
jgi:hypothetical protein